MIVPRYKPPPLIVTAIACCLVEVSYRVQTALTPSLLSPFEPDWLTALYFIGATFTTIGITVILVGAYQFKQHRTTVNPFRPEQTTALVQAGVYKITRNPMYLGMLFVVLGFCCARFSYLGLLWPLCFVYGITLFQIHPEERALKKHFGQEYIDYLQRVRRWI